MADRILSTAEQQADALVVSMGAIKQFNMLQQTLPPPLLEIAMSAQANVDLGTICSLSVQYLVLMKKALDAGVISRDAVETVFLGFMKDGVETAHRVGMPKDRILDPKKVLQQLYEMMDRLIEETEKGNSKMPSTQDVLTKAREG